MPTTVARYFPSFSTSGCSDAARYLSGQSLEIQERFRDSFSLGNGMRAALEALAEEFEECQDPNWDGFGAKPVSEETYRNAYLFLESLPAGTPAPEVTAEPDGHFSLEWYHSPRQTLSISVTSESDLHYAALLGSNKVYGTEVFFGRVPERLYDLIAHFMPLQ